MFCTFCSVASASKQACECSSLIVPAHALRSNTAGIHVARRHPPVARSHQQRKKHALTNARTHSHTCCTHSVCVRSTRTRVRNTRTRQSVGRHRLTAHATVCVRTTDTHTHTITKTHREARELCACGGEQRVCVVCRRRVGNTHVHTHTRDSHATCERRGARTRAAEGRSGK